MAYRDINDSPRRTACCKLLCQKAFNIAKNDGYQPELASMVYTFFDKNSSGGAVTHVAKSASKIKIILNQQLTVELHSQLSENLKNVKYAPPLNLKTLRGVGVNLNPPMVFRKMYLLKRG